MLINEPRGKEIRLKTPKGRVWHLQARPCLLSTEKVPGKLQQKVIHTHLHNDLRMWTQHPKQGLTKSLGGGGPRYAPTGVVCVWRLLEVLSLSNFVHQVPRGRRQQSSGRETQRKDERRGTLEPTKRKEVKNPSKETISPPPIRGGEFIIEETKETRLGQFRSQNEGSLCQLENQITN